MSEFASGLFDPFIVTKILTTLGATFFTIGAKLLPSFTSRANRAIVHLHIQWRILCPVAFFSVAQGETRCQRKC